MSCEAAFVLYGSDVNFARQKRGVYYKARSFARNRQAAAVAARMEADFRDQAGVRRACDAPEPFGVWPTLQGAHVGPQLFPGVGVNLKLGEGHRLRDEAHLAVGVDRPDEPYVQRQVRGLVEHEVAQDGRAEDVSDDVILVRAGVMRFPVSCHSEDETEVVLFARQIYVQLVLVGV